jgi:hypothetical protein
VDVRFDAVEFTEAIGELNEKYGNAVQLDHARIADAKIDLALPVDAIVEPLERRYHLPADVVPALRDAISRGKAKPITLAARGITLRCALRHMVRQVDDHLTVLDVEGGALVTTLPAAREEMVTRVYDVRGLSPPPRPVESPLLVGPDELEPRAADPSDAGLRDLIVSTIAPDTWDDVGGQGSVHERDGVLVVLQSPEVQELVGGLVRTLRQWKDREAGPPPSPRTIRISGWPAGAEAEGRIRSALGSPTNFSTAEITLTELARIMGDEFGFLVVLDHASFPRAARQQEARVRLEGNGRRLETALELALAPLELAAVVRDEALVITSDEKAESQMQLVVHSLSGIADAAQPRGSTAGGLRETAFVDGPQDVLIGQIETTIAPESWAINGGPGAVRRSEAVPALVVWQTEGVQRRVEELLDSLRQVRGEVAPAAEGAPDVADLKVADEYVMVVFRLWQPWHAGAHIGEEQIAEEIKVLVEPQSWLGEEPFIRVLPSRLIIRQRPTVHLKVYSLLRDLGVLRAQEDEGGTRDMGLSGFGGFGGGGLGGFGAGGFGALPSGGQ